MAIDVYDAIMTGTTIRTTRQSAEIPQCHTAEAPVGQKAKSTRNLTDRRLCLGVKPDWQLSGQPISFGRRCAQLKSGIKLDCRVSFGNSARFLLFTGVRI